ncbi:Uncharacterised protein [BD1-7 clade bacterium]|uniref:Lipoprotein n=1 Tax=BD1-7 clade bacterium TaxID=2029982 RepID=A0A5S9PFX3_9GAMM|nr:Uncharacterised protein [BD1-7 clade bacterium]
MKIAIPTTAISMLAAATIFSGCITEPNIDPTAPDIPDPRIEEDKYPDAQIINKNANRFLPASYISEKNIDFSLEGTWMEFHHVIVFSEEQTFDTLTYEKRRTCELSIYSGTADLYEGCEWFEGRDIRFTTGSADSQMLLKEGTETLDSPRPFFVEYTVEMIDLSHLRLTEKETRTEADNTQTVTYFYLDMVRIADKNSTIGSYTVNRLNYEGNLQQTISRDVIGLSESSDYITLTTDSGSEFSFYNNINTNGYDASYAGARLIKNLANQQVSFEELWTYLGITTIDNARDFVIRELNISKLDAQGLDIDATINQSFFYEKDGDTTTVSATTNF